MSFRQQTGVISQKGKHSLKQQSLGIRFLRSVVEFDIEISQDGSVAAKNITGPDGVLLTLVPGPLGSHYRHIAQPISSLELHPDTDDRLSGVICRYSNITGKGLIEILDANSRYQRVNE